MVGTLRLSVFLVRPWLCVGEAGSANIFTAPNLDAVGAHISLWEEGGEVDAVFFDIDETIVIPAAPFIDGLPRSDAFVQQLKKNCAESAFQRIDREMERLYYESPHILVETASVEFLKGLEVSKHVVALTARDYVSKYSRALLDDLSRLGIGFSDPWAVGGLQGTSATVVNATSKGGKVGGMIFAGGANKGEVISEYIKLHQWNKAKRAVLVDNSLGNCKNAALAVPVWLGFLCLHYTPAYRLGGEFDDLVYWTSTIQGSLGIRESECPVPKAEPTSRVFVMCRLLNMCLAGLSTVICSIVVAVGACRRSGYRRALGPEFLSLTGT